MWMFLMTLFLRALALALASLVLSQVEHGYRLRFVATYGVIFALVLVPCTALEVTFQAYLGRSLDRYRVLWILMPLGSATVSAFLVVTVLPLARPLGLPLVTDLFILVSLACLLAHRNGICDRPGLGLSAFVGYCVLSLAILVVDPGRLYSRRYDEVRDATRAQVATLVHVERTSTRAAAPRGAHSDEDLARALAHGFMSRHPPHSLRWSWEEAVAVHGLLAYARVTRDQDAVDFARAYVRAHRSEALLGPLWADVVAPTALVLALPPTHLDQDDALVLARVDKFLRKEAPRTRAGTLSHSGALLHGWLPNQAWVDSLFMYGLYLNERGRHGCEAWAREEATGLARSMVRDLWDPTAHLFRHASIELGPWTLSLPVEPAYWARGNAWALYFLVTHASTLKACGADMDEDLDATLKKLLGAILAKERSTGLFGTELSAHARHQGPIETSASALIVAAIHQAHRAGMLPVGFDYGAFARRSSAALRRQVRWEGGWPVLGGTSTATHPGSRAFYHSIPIFENAAHGVGATLLALAHAAVTPNVDATGRR